jgi:predicted ribosomally synthesized peptide with nif11-like leader
MSQKNIEQFYNLVSSSQELQEQLGAVEDQEQFAEMAVNIGRDNGYSFTVQDVNNFISSNREMQESDQLGKEELEAVAGGRSCPVDTRFTFCVVISSCWGSKC